jgi:uncharacterized protein (DUF58 family)
LPVPVPTARFAAALAAVAVLALAVPDDAVVALVAGNGLVLLVGLVDGLLCAAPAAIEVRRAVPDTITLGHEGTLTWRVANPTARRQVVDIADELAPSLRAEVRRVRLRLPPESAEEVDTAVHPTRRGRFDISEISVRVRGPLGVVARQASREVPATVRVIPPFRSRDEAELRINKGRILEIGLRSAKGRGGGTEFDQLREYNVDDDVRRMDWATTARTGTPVVRTFRAERNQTVIALLDNGRVMAGRVDGVPRVEHAMDAVMCLTTVATRLGDRAGLVVFDRQVRAVVPPGTGRTQLTRINEAMFSLDPELAESDYQGAFTETLARFRRRALLVILTDLGEAAITDSLLPAMPMISRSHLVVVAAVQDPDVVRWAAAVPIDEGEAYLKAAAVDALEQRRRITARLRGTGATVVDAPPGRLAADLADAYLRVKAAGRL